MIHARNISRAQLDMLDVQLPLFCSFRQPGCDKAIDDEFQLHARWRELIRPALDSGTFRSLAECERRRAGRPITGQLPESQRQGASESSPVTFIMQNSRVQRMRPGPLQVTMGSPRELGSSALADDILLKPKRDATAATLRQAG